MRKLIGAIKIGLAKLIVGSQIDRTIKGAKNKEQLINGLVLLFVQVALETYKDMSTKEPVTIEG